MIDSSEEATLDGLDDFNAATGLTVAAENIQYFNATKSGTAYTKDGDALGEAPTAVGDYIAEITLSGVKTGAEMTGDVTASVGYTVSDMGTRMARSGLTRMARSTARMASSTRPPTARVCPPSSICIATSPATPASSDRFG